MQFCLSALQLKDKPKLLPREAAKMDGTLTVKNVNNAPQDAENVQLLWDVMNVLMEDTLTEKAASAAERMELRTAAESEVNPLLLEPPPVMMDTC